MKFVDVKRHLLKRSGLTSLFWKFRKSGVYCFNFHRIGDWQETELDPCVFSCDQADLRRYLEFIQENFRVISLNELIAISQSKKKPTERLAFISFDDGYIDNYQLAYPVLRERGVSATFFITTSLIESDILPWWDEIVWHVRQCAGTELKLPSWSQSVPLPEVITKQLIRTILHKIKASGCSIEQQLHELRVISAKPVPESLQRHLFMNWSQLREMASNGMTIGAHSHSHQIFSCLTKEELNFELSHCKQILEKELGKPVRALSYPVGGLSTFDASMFEYVDQQGYRVAFSFQSALNIDIAKHKFRLGRFPIDGEFNQKTLMQMCLLAPQMS